jgi:integral membrane sensor domain MASE1
MAGTPLLLWVAWSETVLFAALISCLLAIVLLGVCLGPDKTPGSRTERAF